MSGPEPVPVTPGNLPSEGVTESSAASPPRIAVLVSGRGTNLQSLIDAIKRGELFAQIALVISNHAHAPALERAAEQGLPTLLMPRQHYASREAQQAALPIRQVRFISMEQQHALIEQPFQRSSVANRTGA